ncbi:MAG: hypothetical protein JZU63_10235, partial [Rhodoferax sp.]|nr:hypothetical protein [Rhodoferax sp.]
RRCARTLADDPTLDGTDNAHPAYWRGEDAGVRGTLMRLQQILDGKDDGSGVLGDPKLESFRRRLMQLVSKPAQTGIPVWAKTPTSVPIQALREFVAPFGPDVSVLVTWTHGVGWQLVTVGCDAAYADAAVSLRDFISNALRLHAPEAGIDLRSDHKPNAPWTDEQKAALEDVFTAMQKHIQDVPIDRILAHLLKTDLERRTCGGKTVEKE